MPFLFDSHTHLQFSAFDKDRNEVIKRTRENKIWTVNVGSQKTTSQKSVELANEYPEGIYATVGIHPIHTAPLFYGAGEFEGDSGFKTRSEEFDYEFYKTLGLDKKVVAIGECGLDYYKIIDDKSQQQTREKQKDVFIKHIDLARELNKPLMIHCRQAFDDLIRILKDGGHKLPESPGIIHFFTGSLKDAKILLNMGFYFTFGGLITHNRDFDEIIKFLPIEKILTETDAPYVSPEPYREKRNEPIYMKETAKKLAEIKNISFEESCKQTTQNAFKVFGIGK